MYCWIKTYFFIAIFQHLVPPRTHILFSFPFFVSVSYENKKHCVPYVALNSYIWKKKKKTIFFTNIITIFFHNVQYFYKNIYTTELILLKIKMPQSCFHIPFSFTHFFMYWKRKQKINQNKVFPVWIPRK